MIIDDENHIRRLIGRMLEGVGFKVIEADSGKRAFSLLRSPSNRPDVITCDITMPDMDGFEFLQKIKSDSILGEIPVIMLTSMGQIREIKRAKDMGASDYITKPFSAATLVDILNKQAQ
jgi:CheY-like chemotaxis protein